MEKLIKSEEELKEICKKLREGNKTIITINGCFDILHSAHVFLLKKAKEKGDKLIVLLNSDDSIKRYKGDKRPIINEGQRAFMLSSLECVDYIKIYEEDTPLKKLEIIKPDIHVKGKSYDLEKIKEEKDLLAKWGGQLISINEKEQEGISTTDIIEEIIKKYSN